MQQHIQERFYYSIVFFFCTFATNQHFLSLGPNDFPIPHMIPRNRRPTFASCVGSNIVDIVVRSLSFFFIMRNLGPACISRNFLLSRIDTRRNQLTPQPTTVSHFLMLKDVPKCCKLTQTQRTAMSRVASNCKGHLFATPFFPPPPQGRLGTVPLPPIQCVARVFHTRVHHCSQIPHCLCALLRRRALFLLYTPELSELILNAIALGFILELDELTFDFLSETMRTIMMRTEPVTMLKLGRFRVMYVRPIFVVVVFLATGVGLWNLNEVLARMEVALEILCGGQADFAFVVDGALGVVRTGTTGTLPENDKTSYRLNAVLQELNLDWEVMRSVSGLWWSDYVVVETPLCVDDTTLNIDEMDKYSDSEAMDAVACMNHDTDAYLIRLREIRENESLTGFSYLTQHCGEADVRMWCAITCNCAIVYSGMYQRAGCSSSCDTVVLAEVSELANELYEVGGDSDRCTSEAQGWQDTFWDELLLALVDTGHLEQRGGSQYVWSAASVDEFNSLEPGRFYVSSEGLDINMWLDRSVVGQHHVHVIPYCAIR